MPRFFDQRVRHQGLRGRRHLAGLRLVFLFSIACFLVTETGLLVRTTQDGGWDLGQPLPVMKESGRQLPFLGINVALEQYATTERRDALARLRQHGFGWVRQRLDWGLLEPQPGRYNWQMSDALVAAVVAADLVPILVLDGSPAWARASKDTGAADNPFAPPADPATFARFAATLAQRYQNRVRFYQLWDEPNIAPHWGNRLIDPVGYAQFLKITAPAIRAANPDAVIITAALAPTRDRGHLAIDEIYFLQRLYAAGAAPYFDVVAAQPFGFGYAADDGRARAPLLNFQRVKLLRRTMIAAGDGATPIWAVRYGWNIRPDSPWRTVTSADQIAFATTALTLARDQWPWLTAIGWAIDQPALPPSDPQWGFALTEELADAFRTWSIKPTNSSPTTTGHTLIGWRWAGLLVAWLLVGWRMIAALRLLPWLQWRQRYTARPLWQKGGGWLMLVALYYITTWPPLIVLCWLIATLFLLPNPAIGLSLAALLLPFYFQHKEIDLAGNLVKIPPAHAALFCLWLALVASARRLFIANSRQRIGEIVRQWHPVDWLALFWVITCLLTSVNVWHWPAYGQGLLNLTLLPVLAYGATRGLTTTPARQTQMTTAIFGGGLLAAVIGLVTWWQGQGTAADGVLRLVGLYFSPNHTALYLERMWWLGLGLALSRQGVWRRWFLVGVGVVGVALWLTASRGAWLLGMPAGALVFAWAARLLQRPPFTKFSGGPRRTVPLIGSVVALLVIVLGLAVANPLWERLTNSATVTERLIIWQATWQLWQDHWLLGVGPGGFFWRYPSYLGWSAHSDPNLLHPHNLWFELLAGWGIVGLLWFLLIAWQVGRIAYTMKLGSKEQPAWRLIGLLAALAAGAAHGQVDTFTSLPDLTMWNWLVLGLLVNGMTMTTPNRFMKGEEITR